MGRINQIKKINTNKRGLVNTILRIRNKKKFKLKKPVLFGERTSVGKLLQTHKLKSKFMIKWLEQGRKMVIFERAQEKILDKLNAKQLTVIKGREE